MRYLKQNTKSRDSTLLDKLKNLYSNVGLITHQAGNLNYKYIITKNIERILLFFQREVMLPLNVKYIYMKCLTL